MDIERAKELLVDYLNGHLLEDERRQIEELLEHDPQFSSEAETARRELHLFRNSMEDPFEDARLANISEDVMKRIRERKGRSFTSLTPAWRSYLRAALALFIIVFGLAFYFYLRPMLVAPSAVETAETEDERPVETATGDESEAESSVIRLSLATTNPKVKIYWTLSKDFEPLFKGE